MNERKYTATTPIIGGIGTIIRGLTKDEARKIFWRNVERGRFPDEKSWDIVEEILDDS